MALPRIVIATPAAKRLRNFDCWAFRDELVRAEASLAPGDLVDVLDEQGAFVARAFYNPRSHIVVRVIHREPGQAVDEPMLRASLERAIARRATIRDTDALRLVFSEADELPGLIVDRYTDYLVVQFRSAGMDRLRPLIIPLLRQLLKPKGILERSDKEFREAEGLEPVNQILLGSVPERIRIHEHGLQFWVDPHRGAKTGFYLDQRDARRRLREIVEPSWRVLDAFCYTGALGIAAASRGARVVCVEQHEPFLELAKENAALNGVADRIEFVAGNAFYWLEAKASSPAPRFEAVVLDPPALAKSKTETTQGRQALHHLVTQGLGLVAPGGVLALSVCTYHLLHTVEEIVRIAASKRGERLIVREQWLQAADHPWILQAPATRYLTTWLFSRDARSAGSSTTPGR